MEQNLNIQIRKAREEDLSNILVLFKEVMTPNNCFREEGEKRYVHDSIVSSIKNGFCAVAVSPNNEILGFTCGISEDLSDSLNYRGRGFKGFCLALKRQYRGRGLGRDLLQWREERAIQTGHNYIWLGSEDRFNNSHILSRHYTRLTEGKHIHFFARYFEANLQVEPSLSRHFYQGIFLLDTNNGEEFGLLRSNIPAEREIQNYLRCLISKLFSTETYLSEAVWKRYIRIFDHGIPSSDLKEMSVLKEMEEVKVFSASKFSIQGECFSSLVLDNLEYFNLIFSYEPIENLDSILYQTKKLKYLRLDHLGLSKFPRAILQLASLQVLSIDGNDFTTIPDELANLKHLKYLFIDKKIDLSSTLQRQLFDNGVNVQVADWEFINRRIRL